MSTVTWNEEDTVEMLRETIADLRNQLMIETMLADFWRERFERTCESVYRKQ